MKPSEHYQQILLEKQFNTDQAQQAVMHHFDQLYDDLVDFHSSQHALGGTLRRLLFKQAAPTGIYLWGGVGRGKTWLMDIFYECLPFEQKHRLHFHRFMREVHAELEQQKGHKNPLRLVARSFARRFHLLCLDEFHVSDITDAMILYGLLKSLIHEGVCLVMTSNLQPDELYRDGLQRERFLPAIDLLKSHCKVLKIDQGNDHRLKTLSQAEIYYSPLSSENHDALSRCFEQLVPCQPKSDTTIQINQRELSVYKLADDVIWFDFNLLFNSPRAVADYIELARLFHTVVISDIPVLNQSNEDKTRRFIQLIDEFYDRKVKVLISAAASITQLYQGELLKFEFERTISRLTEMQSDAYLRQVHRA